MTAYFGWRRAELAHWLKWVPDVEQVEMFVRPMGVDMGVPISYLDNEVSVSALEAEARDGDSY